MSGRDNYKFGQKNIWRRWAWNKICSLSDKKPKDLFGLYLIGNNDDSKIALHKGLKKSNIIGIDVEKEKVNFVRKNGGIGINISLSDAIFSWDDSLPLDFINADFCCGLNKQLRIFLISLRDSYAINENSVIVINMLRGREKGYDNKSSHLRLLRPMFENKSQNIIGDIDKHRGIQVLDLVYILTLHCDIHDKIYSSNELEDNISEFYKKIYHSLSFYSYKSISNNCVNIMDSIAFKWPTDKYKTKYNVKIDKNKIAAAKAIRTMRLNHRLMT